MFSITQFTQSQIAKLSTFQATRRGAARNVKRYLSAITKLPAATEREGEVMGGVGSGEERRQPDAAKAAATAAAAAKTKTKADKFVFATLALCPRRLYSPRAASARALPCATPHALPLPICRSYCLSHSLSLCAVKCDILLLIK